MMRTESGAETEPNFTECLDGFRGLLALWVFFSHATQFVGGPGGIVNRGGIAVDLFMMVSGFLMVWTVSSRATKEPFSHWSTWQKFYIRRFFRIAPLYFVALIIAYTFSDYYFELLRQIYVNLGKDFYRPFLQCQYPVPIDIFLHLTFIFGLFPCAASSNVLPDWSLSLEMQFYAVFPILFI